MFSFAVVALIPFSPCRDVSEFIPGALTPYAILDHGYLEREKGYLSARPLPCTTLLITRPSPRTRWLITTMRLTSNHFFLLLFKPFLSRRYFYSSSAVAMQSRRRLHRLSMPAAIGLGEKCLIGSELSDLHYLATASRQKWPRLHDCGALAIWPLSFSSHLQINLPSSITDIYHG